MLLQSDGIYSQHSRSVELSEYHKLGNKLLRFSTTILLTSEEIIITRFNIYELSKNTKTDIHTSMLYYNIPTLACVLKILNGSTKSYMLNSKINGSMVTQIIKFHVEKDLEYSLM